MVSPNRPKTDRDSSHFPQRNTAGIENNSGIHFQSSKKRSIYLPKLPEKDWREGSISNVCEDLSQMPRTHAEPEALACISTLLQRQRILAMEAGPTAKTAL